MQYMEPSCAQDGIAGRRLFQVAPDDDAGGSEQGGFAKYLKAYADGNAAGFIREKIAVSA